MVETLAIIINYKSADPTVNAVRSVLDSPSLGKTTVVVVDNSRDEKESAALRSELPSDVKLVVGAENLGFGCACNLAYRRFPGELILLLNPDAKLLPGALIHLQERLLSEDKIAAVGPKIYWDDGLTYYLPPSLPPNLILFNSVFNAWGPGAIPNKIIRAVWRRHCLRVWRTDNPLKVNNLSGGHVLLKRTAVRKAGGLFDDRFFLYFEDTDLCIRLQKRGYDLVIEPRATVVHHYDQCGKGERSRKKEFMAESYRRFMEKHCSGWKYPAKRMLESISARFRSGGDSTGSSDYTGPFTVEVPKRFQPKWLFEWSPNADFLPSVGRFGRGPYLCFSEKHWSMLAPGRYYGRLGGLKGSKNDVQFMSWTVYENSSA